MDAGVVRALFLLCVVFYAAWRWHARLCGQHLRRPAEITEESLAAVFQRKRLYRYGVLGCCILAFGCYYLGLPRPAALVLLTCAGLCQYGVWRERTSCFFPQGAAEAGPPTSARAGGQATAEQTNECSGTGLPVQSLPL